MIEIKLNFYSGYEASRLFFDKLWDYLQDRISEEDKETFGDLMGLFGTPTGEADWEDAAISFYKKRINKYATISSPEVFKILIHFITLLHTEFGYPCSFLIDLLHDMLENPHQHQVEWKIWKEAIVRVSSC